MRRLEECDAKRPAVALEAVTQCRKRAIGIHPFAQISDDLFARLRSVQGLQFAPLLWLRLPDERQDSFGKECSFAVEAGAVDGEIARSQEPLLDDVLEGEFQVGDDCHFFLAFDSLMASSRIMCFWRAC